MLNTKTNLLKKLVKLIFLVVHYFALFLFVPTFEHFILAYFLKLDKNLLKHFSRPLFESVKITKQKKKFVIVTPCFDMLMSEICAIFIFYSHQNGSKYHIYILGFIKVNLDFLYFLNIIKL